MRLWRFIAVGRLMMSRHVKSHTVLFLLAFANYKCKFITWKKKTHREFLHQQCVLQFSLSDLVTISISPVFLFAKNKNSFKLIGYSGHWRFFIIFTRTGEKRTIGTINSHLCEFQWEIKFWLNASYERELPMRLAGRYISRWGPDVCQLNGRETETLTTYALWKRESGLTVERQPARCQSHTSLYYPPETPTRINYA